MIRYSATRWHQTLVNRAHRRTEADWFAPGTYSMAIEWLEKNRSREEFFLWIDTFDPHEPWDPPQHYLDLYDPGYGGRVFEAPPYGVRKKMGITDRELKHIRARYAGEVTMVDHWFGRLMAALESLGIADETVVIFNADHGTCFDGPGDAGFIHKVPAAAADGFRDSGTGKAARPLIHHPLSAHVARIPLLIRLPGRRTPARVPQIVQPWDITATILDLFGVSIPEQVIGHSVLPLLHGDRAWPRTTAVVGYQDRRPDIDRGYAQAMDGKWTYAAWRGERGPALHDRRNDPDCRHNVVREHPAVVRRLTGAIREFMTQQRTDPDWMAGYGFED